MIIDKLTFTDEEIKQLRTSTSSIDFEMLQARAKQRYILSFSKGVNMTYTRENVPDDLAPILKLSKKDEETVRKAILSDVNEILNAITKNEIEEKIKNRNLDWLKNLGDENEKIEKELRKPNWNSCRAVLLDIISLQISAYDYYRLGILELLELVQQKTEEWYKIPENLKEKKNLVKIPHTKQVRKLNKYYYLLDPISTGVFNGETNIETILFVAFIDFENLDGVKLSRKLSFYEKFVWHTCVNLIVQDDHDILTLEQIYKAMGNPGKPNAAIKKEILEAIENISRVRVTIDVPANSELYPEIDQFKGTFQLLATNTKQALSRGQIANNSIQILEKPQLFYFAKAINQLCSFPATVLEVPVSKTKANITILNFLLQKILKMKHDDFFSKDILLNEMYVQCNVDDKFKRSRLIKENGGTLRKMLDHFTEYNFIQEYYITTKYIKITF